MALLKHASVEKEKKLTKSIKITFMDLKVILAHRSYYKPKRADVLSHALENEPLTIFIVH